MAFELRDYQRDACNAVINYVRKRTDPVLIELSTGSGKSVIVAELARFFATAAPHKRVLCIAPSKELVEQNHSKYLAYGFPASIFCSSAGKKSLRQQVIYASPLTAIKQIDAIARLGISAIIIDEAHNDTQTVRDIVEGVRNYVEKGRHLNEKVRVIGMTATPYRMGTGFIYGIDASGDEEIYYDESSAINPYYSRLVYRVTAGYLISRGYLSQVIIGENSDHYDTSTLETDSFGRISAESNARTFEGNSKTERIVRKVEQLSANRRGVMFFAATIQHAEEIAALLPGSMVVTGKTKKSERERIISDFKSMKFKYLINVAVLCVGFDSPHVDVVAILRATESAGLLQQIVGRGLRICEGKENCLILDYAENIERHGLQSDLFTPQIKTRIKKEEAEEITVRCPSCNCVTQKKRRNDPMYDGLEHDEFGNFLIAGTNLVLTTQILDPSTKDEFGNLGTKEVPVPAHYSRRCSNPEAYIIDGKAVPCNHRFSLKLCPKCFAENDISARHCVECKERLVDPNKKLTEQAGFATVMQEGETREVICLGADYAEHTSPSGSKTLKATYKTELGAVTGWHSKRQHWIFNRLCKANSVNPDWVSDYSQCSGWKRAPKFVTLRKKLNSSGYVQFEVKAVRFV